MERAAARRRMLLQHRNCGDEMNVQEQTRNNKGRAINCHPFMIFLLLPEQICPIDTAKPIRTLIH